MGKVKEWAQNHKKAIMAVTVVAVIAGAVVLIINGKRVRVPVEKLMKAAIPNIPEAENIVQIDIDGVVHTFQRSEFIRNLHPGWHASPEAIIEAAKRGITLNPGETFVRACMVSMKKGA